MRKKRIYLNEERIKYCDVFLFKTKAQMTKFYIKRGTKDKDHASAGGVHLAQTWFTLKNKKFKGSKNRKHYDFAHKTGEVLLNLQYCGAGVVSHEFMHAVLWARNHHEKKRQFPIVIKNMDDEEKILYNLTSAVKQFYLWYWKIRKNVT